MNEEKNHYHRDPIPTEDHGEEYLAEGRRLFHENRVRESVSYLQKAIVLLEIKKDWVNYCEAQNILGVAMAFCGNELEALDHYLDALDCARQHQITVSMVSILNNLGSKYQQFHDNEKALPYLLDAWEAVEGMSPGTDERLPLWRLVICMNIANAYKDLGNLKDACRFMEIASDPSFWETMDEKSKLFYFSYRISEARLKWELGDKEAVRASVPELLTISGKHRNASNYLQDTLDLLDLLEKIGDRSTWEMALQSFEQYAQSDHSLELRMRSAEAWLDYFKYFEMKEKYAEACILFAKLVREAENEKNRTRVEAMDLKIRMREKDSTMRKYKALANVDALTGTGNRNKLEQDSALLFQRAIREKIALAIGICDLDHFKKKNDAYGHLVGDAYMTCLVRAIEKTIGSLDNVYRFGGDEFVIMMTEASKTELREMAGKLTQALHEEQEADDILSGLEEITVSQGYAIGIPEWGDTILDLLDTADKALYYVKEHGRNGYRITVPSHEESTEGSVAGETEHKTEQ